MNGDTRPVLEGRAEVGSWQKGRWFRCGSATTKFLEFLKIRTICKEILEVRNPYAQQLVRPPPEPPR